MVLNYFLTGRIFVNMEGLSFIFAAAAVGSLICKHLNIMSSFLVNE